MTRPSRFEGSRYLGDKRRQIVHDLDHLLAECDVDELMAAEAFAAFGPDTLVEARNRGYRPHACARAASAVSDGG